MLLLDLLTGLAERGNSHGHHIEFTAIGSSDLAYLTCSRCELDVTAMVINDLGGWRIRPHIASLDQVCDADR